MKTMRLNTPAPSVDRRTAKPMLAKMLAPMLAPMLAVMPALMLASPLSSHAQTNPVQTDSVQTRPVKAPVPQTWTSPEGARVLLLTSEALPILDIAMDVDAGSRWDPPGLEGLAAMTHEFVGKALAAAPGRPAVSEDVLGRQAAALALQRSGSVSADRASLRFRSLADPETQTAVQRWIREALSRPDFSPKLLSRETAQAQAQLRDALTRPQTIAQRALWSAMYGEHPYGRSTTEGSLGRLTPANLSRFYASHWQPSRMTISLVGPLDRSQAERLVTALLGGLASAAPSPTAQASAGPAPGQPVSQPLRVQYIANPASQAHLWLGMPVLARSETEDFFPFLVANHILGGGGFTARLTREVREQRGLAYSVSSSVQPMLAKGPLVISLQTQQARADEALEVVRQTLKAFVEQGPTEAEITAAKQNLLGGFALRLDANSKLLENLAQIGYYQLPPDYLQRWTASVERVTQAQIQDLLRRRLPLDQLQTVVVGPGAAGTPSPAAQTGR